jgi:hypothetical protein
MWILMPAVVMSLGWGLRGYIGGGPLGAMIPGALVTLILCQYLGYRAHAAAVVVAFGAIGIGFVGEETYGQTLGLLRSRDTFWWGLMGTTLKGAVWGLLGGAVLGLGFIAKQISARQLALVLLCLFAGVIVGIHFINQPKLIYFSDPVNKPRDESWAGFFLAALVLLAYLRVAAPQLVDIPARFALYGLVGGGIGFGAGSLLLALRFRVPEAWHWLPYWKFMEFAFGFLLGAALGRCAWQMRSRLNSLEADDHATKQSHWWNSFLVGVALLVGFFYGWEFLLEAVSNSLAEVPADDVRRSIARVLLGFTGLGCLLLFASRFSETVAWQAAISVTIVAAAIDWERDLLPHGGIDAPDSLRLAFVICVGALSVLFVSIWRQRRQPQLMALFLFATCVLMAIGYLMGLAIAELWQSDPQHVIAGSRAAWLWQRHRSEVVVHAIFTILTLLSIWAACKAWKDQRH